MLKLNKTNIDLQRVASEDDGLLVVAAESAVDHVHLQLQEVVVPEVQKNWDENVWVDYLLDIPFDFMFIWVREWQ